jgi:hypothetical protein
MIRRLIIYILKTVVIATIMHHGPIDAPAIVQLSTYVQTKYSAHKLHFGPSWYIRNCGQIFESNSPNQAISCSKEAQYFNNRQGPRANEEQRKEKEKIKRKVVCADFIAPRGGSWIESQPE